MDVWPAAAQSEEPLPYEAELANLQHSDPMVRIQAIEDIADYGDEAAAAVPALAGLLADNDTEVRIMAARALGEIGPAAAEAVPRLAQSLGDKSSVIQMASSYTIEYREVAVEAAAALGEIGDAARPAVPNLLAPLNTAEEPLAIAIVTALGKMGSGGRLILEALIGRLQAGNAAVSFHAAYALGQLGKSAAGAEPHLRAALRDSRGSFGYLPSRAMTFGEVRHAAAEAYYLISDKAKAVVAAAGGVVLDPDKDPERLPWKTGLRLNLTVSDVDVRVLLAAILRANDLRAAFRHDVRGQISNRYRQVPMAGAFYMMLDEFELTYQFDAAGKLVTIVPLEAVVFPRAPRAVAMAARPATSVRQTRRPIPRSIRKKPKRIAATQPAKTTLAVPVAKPPPAPPRSGSASVQAPAQAPARAKSPPPRPTPLKTVGSEPEPKPGSAKAVAPQPVPQPTAGSAVAKSASPPPSSVLAAGTKTAPAGGLPIQPSRKKTETVVTATTKPVPSDDEEGVIDLSDRHRLSFVVQSEGLYYATIDGQEYSAGFPFESAAGILMITKVQSRSVLLNQLAEGKLKRYVIKFRKRRRRKK